ncbi:PAS domain-containing sensor histidine kinase [Halobellus ordinarius]|uniref:PAS domain-containing sensor histidine kinase n=1 Tax=Halobellus ordinarius TaxID=3075120 RepID=UPI0028806553|nr:PAS domain S-box protein [Halobellus sp. ZY16]
MTVSGSDSDGASDSALRAQRYEKIFRHSNDAVLIVDFESEAFVDANPAACEMLGYPREELLSLDPADLHPGEMDRIRAEFLSQVYENGSGWTDDLDCVTKSGQVVSTEISGAVLPEGETDGEPTRMVAMLRDVTERRRRKREAERTFVELEGVLDSLNDLVFLHDADGTMRYVNEAAVTRLGYTKAELLDASPQELSSREDVGRYDALVERVRKEGSVTFETTLVTAADREIPVEISTSKTRFRGDRALLSVARDVSGRKERERALRRFKKAVQQAAHAVFITDTDGTIEYVNAAFERQTGFAAAEAIGRTPHILDSGTHDEAFFADLWGTLLSGGVWQGEIVNERADASEYYADQTIAPIRDDDGDLEAFVAVSTEITEQKKLERKLTEQRDNLDVLNQMLRHDIRNDLQLVTAYGEMLTDHVGDGGDAAEYLQTVLESAEHAVGLTRTTREMSTVMLSNDADRHPVDLRDTVEAELENCRSSYSEAQITIEEPFPAVDVAANEMLSSVFRNLIENAVQHNDKAVPKVAISASERDGDVAVRIADNGPGIADARKEAIFNKGEKGVDSGGTGLGLFLVETVVEQFDGDIRVEDGPAAEFSDDVAGPGTVFVVEVPTASSAA